MAKCHYFHGQYDAPQAFIGLNKTLLELETKYGGGEPVANRVFCT